VATVGVVALAVSAGITALLAGLLFVRPPRPGPLTIVGGFYVRPEWDVALYSGAGGLTVVLLALFWRLRGRPNGWPAPALRGVAQVVISAVVAAAAVGAFLRARTPLLTGHAVAGRYRVVFAAALVLLGAAALLGRGLPSGRRAAPTPALPFLKVNAFDVLFPAAAVAAVFAPAWGRLAGFTYQLDYMLHWDYFAMGPAIAFSHGQALGTDVHVFYGVGWPVLFAALSPVFALSYTHMIAVNVVVSCLYLVGAYVLLRMMTHDRALAGAGTMLVLVFHMFARSAAPFAPYWGFPSLGILRWSFDVWAFIALLRFQHTGDGRWAAAAGLIVGLAVVFETDTGVYLAAACAFYWACSVFLAPSARRLAKPGLVSAAVAAATLLLGLAIASRGTILRADFWSGWLENLGATSSGLSLLPITTGVGSRVVIAFVVMAATYLMLVSRALLLTARRRATGADVMLGALAAYGYLVLLYFVGRSTPYNLVRASIPFAFVFAILGAGVARSAALWWPSTTRAARMLAVAGVAAVLVANPVFRQYERHLAVAGTLAGGALPEGHICLVEEPRDLCGLAPEFRRSADDVRGIAARLRALAPPGKNVAVLDQTGPMFHLASGTEPWGRFSPLFHEMLDQDRLDAVEATFRRSPPDVVVIRAGDQPLFADVVSQFRALLVQTFVLDSRIGDFEIWRRA
jgi:hypothetical protein